MISKKPKKACQAHGARLLLPRLAIVGIFLQMLKHIYDSDIEKTFERILPELVQLQSNKAGQQFIESVMIYLIHASPTEKGDTMMKLPVQSMTEEVGGNMITLAQQIKREAAEAAQQQERRRYALILQQKGFSHAEIAGFIDISLEEVEELLRPIAS